MAYERRTWYQRLGQGLNKFLIGEKDAEGKQELTNAPDSITQQGDVISADNLNDLEGRINDAILGLSGYLIWENSSPYSAFASQNVDISNSPYLKTTGIQMFAIEWAPDNTSEEGWDGTLATKRDYFSVVVQNLSDKMSMAIALMNTMDSVGTPDSRRVSFRQIDGQLLRVQFYDCIHGSTTNNNYIIPLRIYAFM